MTKQEMPQKYRLEEIKPHLNSIYLKARESAVEDIRASKDYLAKIEAFADTDRFKKLTEQKDNALANVEEYFDFVQTIIDKTVLQTPDRDFENIVYYALNSSAVQGMYGITYYMGNGIENTEEKITSETWREVASKQYLTEIEEGIESEQKQYADREMKLNVYFGWMSHKEKAQFNALVAIMPLVSSMEKMETFVREGLDYSKIVVNS